ncbi:PorP/SprF family type IX secretion system membrane protein [Winogradskyella aurantiaca]|uniref:PorP/SprF family type IX secretion system membrane protein n=1 Tax=Winogradskyella aurantiaca TaxID=2219558 RepID=UPI000E1CA8B1|nr:type IX secretion system membrane protein PorP/SprF [Winogradskyella aurantiaca]
MYRWLLLLLLVSSLASSQQDPQYTQYMYNMAVINPAYAGSKGHWSMGALYRNQWTGLRGAPETGTLFLHKGITDNWGVGGSLVLDHAGPITETNAYADLAYRIPLGENKTLSFGVKLGATFHNIGLADLEVFDPNDPFFSQNVNSTTPNFGAGLYYYTDRFYAGFSVPNMLNSAHLNVNGSKLGSEIQHYFLTVGYVFQVSDQVDLKPSLLLKSAFNAPTSLDVNVNARFNQWLELGVSYRTIDAVSALVNVQIARNLRIGYAYDYITSQINAFGSSSSEIIVLFDILPKEKRIKSPRFF